MNATISGILRHARSAREDSPTFMQSATSDGPTFPVKIIPDMLDKIIPVRAVVGTAAQTVLRKLAKSKATLKPGTANLVFFKLDFPCGNAFAAGKIREYGLSHPSLEQALSFWFEYPSDRLNSIVFLLDHPLKFCGDIGCPRGRVIEEHVLACDGAQDPDSASFALADDRCFPVPLVTNQDHRQGTYFAAVINGRQAAA